MQRNPSHFGSKRRPVVARHRVHRLGQHRLHRRHHGQVHGWDRTAGRSRTRTCSSGRRRHPRARPRRRGAAARAWLAASVAKPRGEGDGDWRAFRAKTDDQDAAQLEMARAWQRTKFDAGWAAPHWPREFGGQGLSGIEAGVVAEEEAHFDVAANFFVVGIDMAGPTLMAHGTPEQQKRFLEPMLRGDESWCQLFSEPGLGLGPRVAQHPRRAGRRRVGARRAEGVDLVGPHRGLGRSAWPARTRTSPSTPGITYFLVDMHAPGVDVRPLRQIDGAIHFNEVFLDGVRVPARPRRRRRRRRLARRDDDAHRRAHVDRRGRSDRVARGGGPGPAVRPRRRARASRQELARPGHPRDDPALARLPGAHRDRQGRAARPGGVGAQAGQQPPGRARRAR